LTRSGSGCGSAGASSGRSVAGVAKGRIKPSLYLSEQNNSHSRSLHSIQQDVKLVDLGLVDVVFISSVVVTNAKFHRVHHHSSIAVTSSLSDNVIPCLVC